MKQEKTNYNKYADDFLDKIEKYIDYKLDGMVKIKSAIVTNINNTGTVDVYFPPDKKNIFTNISNQSIYQDLKIGDGVKIIFSNGNASNCWIIGKHQV